METPLNLKPVLNVGDIKARASDQRGDVPNEHNTEAVNDRLDGWVVRASSKLIVRALESHFDIDRRRRTRILNRYVSVDSIVQATRVDGVVGWQARLESLQVLFDGCTFLVLGWAGATKLREDGDDGSENEEKL